MKSLKLAIYHGYELTGSGGNEYTRYLSRTLASLGHEVIVICAEPEPETFDFVRRVICHDADGTPTERFRRTGGSGRGVTVHQLPRASVFPVFITDQPRVGPVKPFSQLTDAELADYHQTMVSCVTRVLRDERPDILHANHLVYQPVVAAEACAAAGVPFYIVPHGSAIEYTIGEDERYLRAAREGLLACSGVAWISREVRERVHCLYPELIAEIEAKSEAIGIGTDTSLFAPLPRTERRASLDRLESLHVPGGKTPALRAELRDRLDAGEIEATRDYWTAYDHKLPDDDLPEILRRIPVDRDLLFFVGSMTWGKGIQSLIGALPGIVARRPDTHLVLVGSGTYREVLEGLIHSLVTQNEALFDALVAKGRDLESSPATGPLDDLAAHVSVPAQRAELFENGPGLRGRVHILGRLDHAKLRCIFPCCRIGVFPSLVKEASPLVFAEAMANGVLPTGSYHSGLRDGLDDLRPHLPDEIWQHMKLEVDPARRIAAMADSLTALLEALEKQDLGPALRDVAERRFDWKSVAAELAEFATSMVV